MMVWLIILVISIFNLVIGFHNLNHYDELVPREMYYDRNVHPVVKFPVLTAEEKLIGRYKIYLMALGTAGIACSLCHLLSP